MGIVVGDRACYSCNWDSLCVFSLHVVGLVNGSFLFCLDLR